MARRLTQIAVKFDVLFDVSRVKITANLQRFVELRFVVASEFEDGVLSRKEKRRFAAVGSGSDEMTAVAEIAADAARPAGGVAVRRQTV